MSLEDNLNTEFAEAWRPEAGDMLIGEVVEISSRTGEFGTYPIVTLRSDGGERLAVHAFHFVLLNELKRIRPQIGHRIGIKYLGRPSGKNYDAYRVATENPPVTDWEAADRADQPAPPSTPEPANGYGQAMATPTSGAQYGDHPPF